MIDVFPAKLDADEGEETGGSHPRFDSTLVVANAQSLGLVRSVALLRILCSCPACTKCFRVVLR